MSHTNGPWTMMEPSDRFGDYDLYGADGKHFGTFRSAGWKAIKESDANATLISLAPEMLEALKQLLEYAIDDPKNPSTRPNTHLIQRAEALIRRIETDRPTSE